jgi:TPR repeat protein
MRTSERLVPIALFSLTLGLASAFAFDGTRSPNTIAPAVSVDVVPRAASAASTLGANSLRAPEGLRALTPVEAFRSGAQALRAGDTKGGLTSLEYAAANGHPIAQWKLGRMYAAGDGVKRDDIRAFEYFRGVADAHADESPGTARARFVANAFVALGVYYLDGIPNSAVKADRDRARDMFAYAAFYFGDPDAQYHLGRIYLEATGAAKDPKQAVRWLQLAANKGQYQAQAILGAMLFKGETVPRQAARGLMWLTLARDAASAQEPWITELHAAASQQATDDERALALTYLERWLKGRRD